ncbi:PAP2 superfamily protein [Caloramator quimbayensis]|uniref:PAP2 superfamily protein n=1 Tax=Caloramator quimbayensis TaxID=1147123 RepID=A0A1T4X3Y9_9CLOT|nr:phosphatase PAP2 family protein [Caloramator quimbayensis]SKA84373.1 PAP2 superfamily protein [Caloramator quimbayensis]
MKVIRKIYDFIPKYAIKPLILCVLINFSVYSGARLFYKNRVFHDLTTNLDNSIPVVPIFIVFYLGSYLFWIFNYILISRISEDNCYRLAISDILGKLTCFIIYITFPTTNVRPELTSTNVFVDMLKFLYSVDAANNLFPSIHVLVSWYCFAGIRCNKTIPLWYRYFSLFMAVMISISTLTTKQHVIADVIAGVVLAELTWQFSLQLQLYKLKKLIKQEA